jgi:hypothetical protein
VQRTTAEIAENERISGITTCPSILYGGGVSTDSLPVGLRRVGAVELALEAIEIDRARQ